VNFFNERKPSFDSEGFHWIRIWVEFMIGIYLTVTNLFAGHELNDPFIIVIPWSVTRS